MFRVHVNNSSVRHNLDLLKEQVKQKLKTSFQEKKRTFPAYIHKKTGVIYFSSPQEQAFIKSISIQLDLSRKTLEILEENGKILDFQALDPSAVKVVSETFRVLEELIKNCSEIEEIVSLEFFPIDNKDSYDFIHKAWHTVDRIEAEKLLEGKPIGTFLFRKDPYASLLEKELSLALKKRLKCITLSYLAEEALLREVTIICYQDQWQLYEGDPNLQSPAFSHISELLLSVSTLSFPLTQNQVEGGKV